MSLGCHVSCVSVLAHILCSFGVCNSWTCVLHAIPLFYMLYVIYVSPITRTLINTLTPLPNRFGYPLVKCRTMDDDENVARACYMIDDISCVLCSY